MTELEFLKATLPKAYELCANTSVEVSAKAEFDVVTNVDKAIELYFAQEVKKHFPEDTILGEEFSSRVELGKRTWVLDPIDGTYNFSTDSPLFGVQAAFFQGEEICASVIYLPALCELYEAEKGKGAFCNGKRLSVSRRSPKEAIISFGDLSHIRPHNAAEEMEMMKRAYPAIARMRMFGAACFDFVNLAAGKTEGTVLFTRNKWDLAPGMLLAKEAGALLLDVDGKPHSFEARGIFACNDKALYDALN